MLRCGLLGRVLGHSYSPRIHAALGDYEYRLYEKTEEELPAFLRAGAWDGLNVTIPYKKTVLPYCTELSEAAKKTGAVNTLVRTPAGGIFGDNTDVAGFRALVESGGQELRGQKALVLGSGGASAAVCAALNELGAEAVVISRSGENNYANLARHRNAAYIVNTTPLGMAPHTGVSPLDLRLFEGCRGVYDVVYNPSRTALLLQAEALGIPGWNGLTMLVAQARRSGERFLGAPIPDSLVPEITDALRKEMRNLILIGMPGCGKSTLAALLGAATGREVLDADEMLTRTFGQTPEEILRHEGEESFRAKETAVLSDLGKRSGKIIATGGGCVTRAENYPLLHQNGLILWIRRDISALPTEGRPLSQAGDLERMYEVRAPLYRRFADGEIDNNSAPEAALRQILEVIA